MGRTNFLSTQEEKTSMFPSTQYRLYAWAAMLSGLFIIVKKLVIELLFPPAAATNVVGTLGLLMGLFALTGVYSYQREASSKSGLVSYIVIWFGLGAASGADYARNYIFLYMSNSELQALLAGPTKLVLVSSSLFFLVGVILFSVSAFRARVFPRLAVLLFLVGFTLFSLSFLLPVVVSRAGEVVGALGVIWLGYAMWAAIRKTAMIQPG